MTMTKKPFDFITKKTYHPLDEGWSWVVMMGAFGALFIVIGYQRSFGLLFVLFQERYGYSSVLLSAVTGALTFTYCFSTMIVMNFLLKKISIRTSCMIGACFQAIGIISTSFTSDMISLIIFQGCFFGLGHSMLFCPTILIVSQYFERHRSIATAIATLGSSFGGIAFPYIVNFLLNILDLHGALLILGGLVLNQTAFYALYQPIVLESSPDKPLKHEQSTRCVLDNNDTNKVPSLVVDTDYQKLHSAENAILKDVSYEDEVKQKNNIDRISMLEKNSLIKSHHLTPTSQLTSSQTLGPVGISDYIHAGANRLYSSHSIIPNRLLLQSRSVSKEFLNILSTSMNGVYNYRSSMPMLQSMLKERKKNGSSSQILQQKEMADEDRTTCSLTRTLMDDENVSAAFLGNESSTITVSEDGSGKCNWIPSLMRSYSFWLVALYNVGGIISTGCPALYIPPLSKEKGLTDDDATFFLTISAVSDFAGRIGTGVVLHFRLIEPCSLALIPLGLSTVVFNLTFLFNDFSSILILNLVYGLCSSMFWTLQSLVIIQVLGMENLGPALGFYAVIYGITTSASFPFAGWLDDVTGSYSCSFHYFGAMSAVAAVALLIVILPNYVSKGVDLKTTCHCQKEQACQNTTAQD